MSFMNDTQSRYFYVSIVIHLHILRIMLQLISRPHESSNLTPQLHSKA